MGMSAGTLGTAGLGMQAAGGGASVVGAFMGARNQRALLESQARVAEANARIADSGARVELARGAVDARRVRDQGERLKGSQRAAMAANGIDLGSDTAVDALTSTDFVSETDARMVEDNAIRSAWGYRVGAGNAQVDAASRRGTAAGISPTLAGATTLLTEGGRVAEGWYRRSSREDLPVR